MWAEAKEVVTGLDECSKGCAFRSNQNMNFWEPRVTQCVQSSALDRVTGVPLKASVPPGILLPTAMEANATWLGTGTGSSERFWKVLYITERLQDLTRQKHNSLVLLWHWACFKQEAGPGDLPHSLSCCSVWLSLADYRVRQEKYVYIKPAQFSKAT